ncbi:pyridoxamine 5'-phosphate oxidase family protein [Tepidibacillus marianensis]|uniref:pyridoxamine 5'-phosphate oxidase family protein n=1 Tax=Tepidibacillus marianensis TaxID=3131995 RepID=UPI0030CC75AE
MNNKEAFTVLPDNLFKNMQQLRLILLTTMEDTTPYVNAVSWTFAKSPQMIRFAVDAKSQIVKNIRNNSEVALSIFDQETIFTIYGTAKIVTESIEGIPFQLALVEVKVSNVYDVMYYGAKIKTLPETEKTYNQEAAKKLDNQVLEALQK